MHIKLDVDSAAALRRLHDAGRHPNPTATLRALLVGEAPPARGGLADVLDAWTALCGAGAQLTAAVAVTRPLEALRLALASAGHTLPHRPTPHVLGLVLRTLRGRVDGQGRKLARRLNGSGVARWRVEAGPVAGSPVAGP